MKNYPLINSDLIDSNKKKIGWGELKILQDFFQFFNYIHIELSQLNV